jgi:hypothetical protein
MSGEFRELHGQYYLWQVLVDVGEAERGTHRISQAMHDFYKALALIETGAALYEAGDSSAAAPVMALIENWAAVAAAYEKLNDLRKEYKVVIDIAIDAAFRASGVDG